MTGPAGRRRWLGALLAAVGLSVGVGTLGVALPATAASDSTGITSPDAGQVFTTLGQSVPIRADTLNGQLQLTAPGQAATAVGKSGLNPQYPFATACYPAGSACRPAANGTWTITLTGTNSTTRTFVLAIPPKAPTGVTAKASAPGEVTVSWPRGAEPDLASYQVSQADDSQGGLRSTVDADKACGAAAASACSAKLTFTGDRYGGPHTFVVVAQRQCPAGCPDPVVSSAKSAPASAILDQAAPSASTSQGGPASAPGKGKSGFVFGSGSLGPGFGTANLHLKEQPLPGQAGPSVAGQTKLPDGTYKETLGYGDQTQQVPLSSSTREAGPSTDKTPIWRGIAGALVLVLLGAHLRQLLRKPPDW